MAVRFDPVSLTMSGDLVPVMDSVDAGPRGWLDWAAAPNGTLVYAPQGGGTERLVIVDRQGHETPVARERTEFLNPRFSHDGQRIAVSRLDEEPDDARVALNLWVYSLGQHPRRLTRLDGHTQYAAWSVNDDRILFLNEVPGRPPAGYETSPDGNGSTKPVVTGSDTYLWPTDWSQDGRLAVALAMVSSLVFEEDAPSSRADRTQDLAVLSIATGGVRTVPKPGAQYGGRFSPNGRYVAYTSSETKRLEVWIRPVEGWETREWRISHGGGTEPVWASDGRELFYWDGPRLMSVAVDTGERFAAGEPRVILERPYKRYNFGSNYDVHPDGDRFVMIDQDRSEIVVVLNWLEELRGLVEGTQ
jgi:Tol biopolymer transport system component